MHFVDRIRRQLAAPMDAAGLVWFRVIFGLVVTWEMGRYLSHDWVATYWVRPKVLFPYWPFEFVRPWPEPWMMYVHVVVVALAGLAVAAGWYYRVASWILFAGFAWLFLLDQTRYLNHFYLVSLIAFVLACLPAHRSGSLDALAGRVEPAQTTPAWTITLVRFMVGVPYFFGGIAKCTSDWVRGEPMREWLARSTDYPVIGPWLDTEPAVWSFVWGGLLFDLLVVPLLVWRRTRALGLCLSLGFHLLNSRLFRIGIFPWMMILATLVFLPSDWPRRVWDDIRSLRLRACAALASGGVLGFAVGSTLPAQPSPFNAVIAAIGMALLAWEIASYGWDHGRATLPEPAERPVPVPTTALLAVWAAFQVLMPLRHYGIPGDVHWTEEGHRWSWHMKLRDKDVARFRVTVDPPGDAAPFRVRPEDYLAHHQVSQVAQNPEMAVRFAHHLVEALEMPGAAVYVDTKVRLNGREPQRLIDRHQDLTQISPRWWAPAPWILPLRTPLKSPTQAEETPGAFTRAD